MKNYYFSNKDPFMKEKKKKSPREVRSPGGFFFKCWQNIESECPKAQYPFFLKMTSV